MNNKLQLQNEIDKLGLTQQEVVDIVKAIYLTVRLHPRNPHLFEPSKKLKERNLGKSLFAFAGLVVNHVLRISPKSRVLLVQPRKQIRENADREVEAISEDILQIVEGYPRGEGVLLWDLATQSVKDGHDASFYVAAQMIAKDLLKLSRTLRLQLPQ